MACKRLTIQEYDDLPDPKPEGFVWSVCEQQCGACCVPPPDTCYMCDCDLKNTNCGYHSSVGYYYDPQCQSECLVYADSEKTWQDHIDCPITILTRDGESLLAGYKWDWAPLSFRYDSKLGVLFNVDHNGCGCILGDKLGWEWKDAGGNRKNTYAHRLWKLDCSGTFSNVTSLYIDSVADQNECVWPPEEELGYQNAVTTPPSGVTFRYPSNKPSIGDCILIGDQDMPEDYYSNSAIGSELLYCVGSSIYGGEGSVSFCDPSGASCSSPSPLDPVDWSCSDGVYYSDCVGFFNPGTSCFENPC